VRAVAARRRWLSVLAPGARGPCLGTSPSPAATPASSAPATRCQHTAPPSTCVCACVCVCVRVCACVRACVRACVGGTRAQPAQAAAAGVHARNQTHPQARTPCATPPRRAHTPRQPGSCQAQLRELRSVGVCGHGALQPLAHRRLQHLQPVMCVYARTQHGRNEWR
jgi:hypothetical protein